MKLPRHKARIEAGKQVEALFDRALKDAGRDLEGARKVAKKARRIAMKFNLRLPYERRQLICRGCKKLIVPGINARVRLGFKPRAVKIVCLDCGHTYRKVLSRAGREKEKPH